MNNNPKNRSLVAEPPPVNEEERLEKLAAVLNAAGNGATPPTNPDFYGQRYEGLRQELIRDGDDLSKFYSNLAEKYRSMAESYDTMATKIKEAAIRSADDLVRDRVRIEKALALITEEINEVKQ